MPLGGALVGAGANIFGGMMAGDAQKDASNKAYAAQKQSMIKMQEMLESIGIPSIEAQKIILETPEYAGDLIVENLGPSAMEEITGDPRLKSAQMDALRSLQETGKVGLSAEDRAEREDMLRQSAAQGQSQQKQILQEMAQRGNLDSGASLIAQLQSNAAQSSDARRQSEQMAADVSGRRRDAIMRAANLAGNMEGADFGRQSKVASARDRINQFNVQNRMTGQERNLDRTQDQSGIAANTANREETHNKGLLRTNYQDKLGKAKILAGYQGDMGKAAADMHTATGKGQADMYGKIGSGIAGVAKEYFKK